MTYLAIYLLLGLIVISGATWKLNVTASTKEWVLLHLFWPFYIKYFIRLYTFRKMFIDIDTWSGEIHKSDDL